MKFSEYVALKEAYPVGKPVNPYPVGKPVASGVVPKPLTPDEFKAWKQRQKNEISQYGVALTTFNISVKPGSMMTRDQQMRLLNTITNDPSKLPPEEYNLVQQQQRELKQFGFVITPFKLYGGGGTASPEQAFNFK